jgi:branched-chain amino acid transport system permease protein
MLWSRRTQLIINTVVAILVLAFLMQFPMNNEQTPVLLWTRAMYVGIAAMGLNILTGYNGQVSIGHGAFFGIGAYTTAYLVNEQAWHYLLTLPAAAAVAAAIGIAIGFPALRVKGLYLALITLGLAVLFPDIIRKFVTEGWLEFDEMSVGGENLVRVPRRWIQPPGWWPSNADAPDQYAFYVTLFVGIFLLVASWLLVRSRFGRAFIAVRDHEAAASTVGINLPVVKVSAFAISAAYAGVAGALSILVTGVADATRVETFNLSIEFLIAVVIGGTATIIGPLIGGWLVVMVRDQIDKFVEDPSFAASFFRDKEVLTPAIFGIGLILLMYMLPDGIVGGTRRLLRRLASRTRRPAAPATT